MTDKEEKITVPFSFLRTLLDCYERDMKRATWQFNDILNDNKELKSKLEKANASRNH